MTKRLIFLGLTIFPVMLLAQDEERFQCALDELTRRIEIFHEPGASVPCEVHYFKDTEAPGEREVLWRATSEEGYCAAKARELVEKLKETGWTCWTPSANASGASPADDTEALTPAEEIEIPEADNPG
jgi:hypothetical protein